MTWKGAHIIFNQTSLLKLKPDQIIYNEGEYGGRIYIILYGKFSIKTIQDGALGIVELGGILGEEAIMDPDYEYR